MSDFRNVNRRPGSQRAFRAVADDGCVVLGATRILETLLADRS